MGIIENKNHEQKLLVVNHSNKPQKVQIKGEGKKWELIIKEKFYKIVDVT